MNQEMICEKCHKKFRIVYFEHPEKTYEKDICPICDSTVINQEVLK